MPLNMNSNKLRRYLKWMICLMILPFVFFFLATTGSWISTHQNYSRQTNLVTESKTCNESRHKANQTRTRGYGSQLRDTDSKEQVPSRYTLVTMIMSARKNKDRRDVIRDTWKKAYTNSTHYVKFVVSTNAASDNQLENEATVYKDMLILYDLVDSYRNLTRKVLATLQWVDRNLNYSYLLKADDDSFVLLDKLEDELEMRKDKKGLYWGYFIGNAFPRKDGPWAEDKWISCDLYFPYAFGGGYILSSDVIHRISLIADGIVIFNNEDVAVGAWTAVLDIERKHDVRFNTEMISRGCKNSFLVTHKQSITDMQQKHKLYSDTGKLCNKDKVWRELEYNWNVPPSKCYSK